MANYATVTECQTYLRNASADATLLNILIPAYSRAIDDYAQREFSPTADATRRFRWNGNGYLSLAPYEIRSVTSIVVNADQPAGSQTTYLPSDPAPLGYTLEPRMGTEDGTYFSLGLPLYPLSYVSRAREIEVAVRGAWGMAAIPAPVKLACLMAVADGYRNPEGFATRSLGGFSFSEVQEEADAPGRSLPPDARALLTPYRRMVYV